MQTLIYKCNNYFKQLRMACVNFISALTLFVWLCIIGIITGVGHTIRLLTDNDYNK